MDLKNLKNKKKLAALLVALQLLPSGKSEAVKKVDTKVPTNPKAVTETLKAENKTNVREKNNNEVKTEFKSTGIAIDISEFNGELNEEIAKNLIDKLGVDQIMIRSHYVKGTNFVEDSQFRENVRIFSELGIPVGVYFLPRLTQSEEEVKRETQILIDSIKGLEEKYNVQIKDVAIDVEEPSGVSKLTSTVTNINSIIDMLSEFNPIVYSSASDKKDLKYVAEKNGITMNAKFWPASYSFSNSFYATSATKTIDEALNDAIEIQDEEDNLMCQIADNVAVMIGNKKLKLDISVIVDQEMLKEIGAEIDKVPADAIGYVVPEGATVSGICEEFQFSMADFELYNPEIKNLDLIIAGQMVNIRKQNILDTIERTQAKEVQEEKESKGLKSSDAICLIGGNIATLVLLAKISKRRKKNYNNKQYGNYNYNENTYEVDDYYENDYEVEYQMKKKPEFYNWENDPGGGLVENLDKENKGKGRR